MVSRSPDGPASTTDERPRSCSLSSTGSSTCSAARTPPVRSSPPRSSPCATPDWPACPAAQLSSVAATAVPGLVLGERRPDRRPAARGIQPVRLRAGLRRRRSTRRLRPSPTFAPLRLSRRRPRPICQPQQHDLASHNDTSLLSPSQDAGANAQQGAFNLGFGDITLGDKTIQHRHQRHGVVVDGDNDGDIVSGDGAVLGNDNDVNNGDILADRRLERLHRSVRA